MRRRTALLVIACLLLALTAALVLSLPGGGAQCHLALQIVGFTNGPAASRLVTLRLLNDGQQAAQVLPTYGIEAQPAKVDASMLGSLAGGVRTLRPEEAWTNTISLPSRESRSWRVFFRYWKRRSPVNEFGHYWLMQAGIARREEEGFIAYTDWVASEPSSQPNGTANRSQPVRSETNRPSAAAGSGR